MDIAVFWLIASIVVGVIANSRGRDWLRWTGLSILISPLLAGILVLVLPGLAASDGQQILDGTAKKCPMCAELVKPEAIRCKHCGADLTPEPAPSADEIAATRYGG